MSRSPSATNTCGNNKRASPTMNHHALEFPASPFALGPNENAAVLNIGSVAQMAPDWQTDAFPFDFGANDCSAGNLSPNHFGSNDLGVNSLDANNFGANSFEIGNNSFGVNIQDANNIIIDFGANNSSTNNYYGGLNEFDGSHNLTDGQLFSEQEPKDFTGLMQNDFNIFGNFGMASDFDLSSLSSSSPLEWLELDAPTGAALPKESSDFDDKHVSGIADHDALPLDNAGVNEERTGSPYLASPSNHSATKTINKRAPNNKRASNNKRATANKRTNAKKGINNKLAPTSNKIVKSKKTPPVSNKAKTRKMSVENTSDSSAETEDEVSLDHVPPSLADKMKMTYSIIAAQKKQIKSEKKLGKDVSIVYSVNGIYITGVFWDAPSNDVTIPSTQAEKDMLVDIIVGAIRHNRDVREKTDNQIFKNRWADDATHYQMYEFKAVARELVTAMIGIHRNGWTKAIHDKSQRELVQKTMYFTFEERFNCVVELLTASKTSCRDLMKGERLYTIIGNPFVLMNRTESNKNSNGNKAVRIHVGTEVLRKGKKRAREGEGEDDNTEVVAQVDIDERPIKRARMSKA